MSSLTKKQREIAHYTTLGMAVVGLPWHEARRIAKEIVFEKKTIRGRFQKWWRGGR